MIRGGLENPPPSIASVVLSASRRPPLMLASAPLNRGALIRNRQHYNRALFWKIAQKWDWRKDNKCSQYLNHLFSSIHCTQCALKLPSWLLLLCFHSQVWWYGSPQYPWSVSPCLLGSCTPQSSWQFPLPHGQGPVPHCSPSLAQTGNLSWKGGWLYNCVEIRFVNKLTFALREHAHSLPRNLVPGTCHHKEWCCPQCHGSENIQSCQRTWALLERSNRCLRCPPSSKRLRHAIVQISKRIPVGTPCVRYNLP